MNTRVQGAYKIAFTGGDIPDSTTFRCYFYNTYPNDLEMGGAYGVTFDPTNGDFIVDPPDYSHNDENFVVKVTTTDRVQVIMVAAYYGL